VRVSIIAILMFIAAFGSSAGHAQNIRDLIGVVPGEVMPEVQASTSSIRSEMPFVFFSAPTVLPALAKIVPSGELYVMRNGTVVGARWKRGYKAEEDCEAAADATRALLRPYLPREVVGKDRWRYQTRTTDGQIGAGVSCRGNDGNFQELKIELVHFARDEELSRSLGAR